MFSNLGLPVNNKYECFPWGWDEITWYGLQSEEYRNEWLKYLWYEVRCLDSNGFVDIPGKRGMTSCYDPSSPNNPPYNYCVYDPFFGWTNPSYRAINGEFNQENTIIDVWNNSTIPQSPPSNYFGAYRDDNIYMPNSFFFFPILFMQSFVATNQITANDITILSGWNRTFVAGKEIDLEPNFEAVEGSNFEAKIDESVFYCDNPPLSGKTKSSEEIPPPPKKLDIPETNLVKIYPNPYTESANITYSVREPVNVSLTIFDIIGKEMSKLIVEKYHEKGTYNIKINEELPPSIYLVIFKAGDFKETKKLVKLR